MARDIAQPLEAKTHKQISKEIIPIQWHVWKCDKMHLKK